MAIFEGSIRGTGSLGRQSFTLIIELLWQNMLLTDYRQHFPEAFLWEVFHYQVEAAAAMVSGPVSCRLEFDEIVHRDIKPGNSILFFSFGGTISSAPMLIKIHQKFS